MRKTQIREAARVTAYNDGYIEIYDIEDQASGDYPERRIRKRSMGRIWFRQLAVYDRTRITFEQADKAVTRKIAIPQWYDGISSDCVVTVNGGTAQEKVFNAAQVYNKAGMPETELTLINPEMTYEVIT